jgi:hypothetical protein
MPPVQEHKQSAEAAFLDTGSQEQPSTWKVMTTVFAAGWFTYSIYSTATGLWRWIGSKLEEQNKKLADEATQQAQTAETQQAQRRAHRRAWTKNM